MTHEGKNRLILEIPGMNISEPSDIIRITQHVKRNRNREILIVITGSGNISDQLASLAYESSGNKVESSELDELLALGQLLEAQLITTALKSQNVNATYVDPFRHNPIRTIGNSGNPQVAEVESVREIEREIGSKLSEQTVILCGAVGTNEEGKITIIRDGQEKVLKILKRALKTQLHQRVQ